MNILIVLTSHDRLGTTDQPTGFWLEELAGPYYAFADAGASLTLATPKGGQAPIDPKSQDPSAHSDDTRRFEADSGAMAALAATVPLAEVDAAKFDALFFPGGHGPLWDLAESERVKGLVEAFYRAEKPVSAVCHGPAALVSARGDDGRSILADREVTGFSDSEEAAVGLTEVVPFSLEQRMAELGGRYSRGDDWASFVRVDGQVVTGQNPASSVATAKAVLALLG